jgi:hypothetical protein
MPPRDYLLSYPRSGNHWVRFIIEFITGRPTHGCVGNARDLPIAMNSFPGRETPLSHVDQNADFVVWKAHALGEVQEPRRLIFILRDFKECIVRHIDYDVNQFERSFIEYLELISFFDKHQGEKLVIGYENLLLAPSEIVKSLAKILPESRPELVAQFLNNIERYKQLNVRAKGRQWGGCVSRFQSNYHYRRLTSESQEQLRLLAEAALGNYPNKIRAYVEPYLVFDCKRSKSGVLGAFQALLSRPN